MDIQFNNPNNTLYLWAVGVLALLLIMGYVRRLKILNRLATPRLVPRLTTASSNGRRRFRIALLIAASITLCISLLDPRWGTRYREVEQTGIDTFFVLDVSRSMLAEDVRPNRLNRAHERSHCASPREARAYTRLSQNGYGQGPAPASVLYLWSPMLLDMLHFFVECCS